MGAHHGWGQAAGKRKPSRLPKDARRALKLVRERNRDVGATVTAPRPKPPDSRDERRSA